MIRTSGFKRVFLMPSNRRPRVSSFNDAVHGYSIRSDGVISSYPSSQYYSYAISSRYRRYHSGRLRSGEISRSFTLRVPFIPGS